MYRFESTDSSISCSPHLHHRHRDLLSKFRSVAHQILFSPLLPASSLPFLYCPCGSNHGQIPGRHRADTRRIPGGYQADTRRLQGGYQAATRRIPGRYQADTKQIPSRHRADTEQDIEQDIKQDFEQATGETRGKTRARHGARHGARHEYEQPRYELTNHGPRLNRGQSLADQDNPERTCTRNAEKPKTRF